MCFVRGLHGVSGKRERVLSDSRVWIKEGHVVKENSLDNWVSQVQKRESEHRGVMQMRNYYKILDIPRT